MITFSYTKHSLDTDGYHKVQISGLKLPTGVSCHLNHSKECGVNTPLIKVAPSTFKGVFFHLLMFTNGQKSTQKNVHDL